MKTLGIIGGIGPESTIDYYRQVISLYRERTADGSYPPLIVDSIDMKRMLDLVGAGRRAELTGYLRGEIEKLARAGADFGLLASNTPHLVFPDLARSSPLPLLSIVEAAAQAAQALGLARVGLFGTRFTMRGGFYDQVFAGRGIELVTPNPDEQDYIHDVYMGELVLGVFKPETRERLLAIGRRLRDSRGLQGLVLGGTELPLILREPGDLGIPFLDTTRTHVEAAVNLMLSAS